MFAGSYPEDGKEWPVALLQNWTEGLKDRSRGNKNPGPDDRAGREKRKVISGKEGENPEHISSILRRVMKGLQEKFKDGPRSPDPCGSAPTAPGGPSSLGEENESEQPS